VAFLAQQIGLEVAFPWAFEKYLPYLERSSYWFKRIPLANKVFKQKFGTDLDAMTVSRQSRRYEVFYENENSLAPFSWDRIIYSDSSIGVLYLRGKIDLTSQSVLKLIQEHDLTIIHEPFEMIYLENLSLIGEDLSTVRPKKSLFASESQYVFEKTAGKSTVGFHIRRGDYARWQGGSYFYSDDFWIKNASRFIDTDKSVWVFSNDLSDDLRLQLLMLGVNLSAEDFSKDFVRMMLMQKIFGPPSTFSSTAVNIAKKFLKLQCEFVYLPKII